MLYRIAAWFNSLFAAKPVKLAIVRRYCDANGSFVGELYMEGNMAGVSAYRMIGASLDTLPLNWKDAPEFISAKFDTVNDFLAIPTANMVRVGALDPKDNDKVRKMISKFPRNRITLVVQNRFIEHVLENKI